MDIRYVSIAGTKRPNVPHRIHDQIWAHTQSWEHFTYVMLEIDALLLELRGDDKIIESLSQDEYDALRTRYIAVAKEYSPDTIAHLTYDINFMRSIVSSYDELSALMANPAHPNKISQVHKLRRIKRTHIKSRFISEHRMKVA